jgi:hypothetical protein
MTSGSELATLLGATAVVPVLTVTATEIALPLARALVGGGLAVLEITLRTPAALQAIEMIAGEVEGAVVGAGTVRTPAQYGRRRGPAPASWSARALPRRCSPPPRPPRSPSCPGRRPRARSWP